VIWAWSFVISIAYYLFWTAFLRLTVTDPLLCLTVAVTLREKPLALNQSKHPLAMFFASTGGVPAETAPPSPTSVNADLPEVPEEEELGGLEEVNLLEGLSAGN